MIVQRCVLPVWGPVTEEVSASSLSVSLCRAWRRDVWCCFHKMTSGKLLWLGFDFFPPSSFASSSLPAIYALTIGGLLFQQNTKEPKGCDSSPQVVLFWGWPIRGRGGNSPGLMRMEIKAVWWYFGFGLGLLDCLWEPFDKHGSCFTSCDPQYCVS